MECIISITHAMDPATYRVESCPLQHQGSACDSLAHLCNTCPYLVRAVISTMHTTSEFGMSDVGVVASEQPVQLSAQARAY